MRWTDILLSSLSNLLRRKLRSMLTVLGVVIGTAAIVVTMSLGYGAEKTQMEALQQATNLMLIQVSPYWGGASSDMEGGATPSRRITKITDSVLREIRAIEGVEACTPVVNVWASVSFILSTGKYQCYTSLTGVIPEDFAKIVELKDGKFFTGSTERMEFMMSEVAMMEFRDPKKPNDEWIDTWDYLMNDKPLPLPDIKWLRAKFDMTMQWEDYDNISEANPDPEIKTKEYRTKFMGILKSDPNDWTYSNGAIVNLKWLKKLQKDNKKLFKDMGFPDLDVYDNVQVKARSVDDVENVVKELNQLGVQCYSPIEYVNQFKEQIRTMQTFLGFIGAISMMVAALSIANTMMMSIYERTREIGVMKVLGCKLGNIRMMFLSEAAYIGVFGGALGLMASYGLSYALNNVVWLQNMVASIMSGSNLFAAGGSNTSVIPPALALYTWLGVVVVSVASGFYPAQRAMQLSSLAAIRNAD